MVHHRATQIPKDFAFDIVMFEQEMNKMEPKPIHFFTGEIFTLKT